MREAPATKTMSDTKHNKPQRSQTVDTEADLETTGDDEAVKRGLKVSLIALLVMAGLGGIGYGIYRFNQSPEEVAVDLEKTDQAQARPKVAEIPPVRFTDITQQAGIDFVHTNGDQGKKLLPQTMGGGVAFIDFDNDGDQDLFFVNSCYWPGEQPADREPPTMKLYANDGQGKFTDVTRQAGLDVTFYGMGVAVGDYDGDGWRDLFVTAVGKNHLFQNQQGQFVDVTEQAGVGGRSQDWGTSCGFFDYNNDGKLDLFVCNYVDWTAEKELELDVRLTGKIKAYVQPQVMDGAFPYLYRNEGNGQFTDVSRESGIELVDRQNQKPLNKSLGLCFVDINNDGWQDVFVANDTVRNLLFVNQQDGTFAEEGEQANIAYDDKGNARGAMGIDSARFRSDDTLGFVIGNFALEPASLYVKQGNTPIFTDESVGTGLGPETRIELTFGMCFFDYDLDGRLDILTANGHLEEEIHEKFKRQSYLQPPHLFWNAGEDQRSEFVTVGPDRCGEDLVKPMAGRGLAYADIDQDGDLDVIVTAVNAPPRLLRNDQQTGHHWLTVQLDGGETNRDGFGATVIVRSGETKLERFVSPTRSYLSQMQIPVHFGLGELDPIDRIEVIWPDGQRQEFSPPAVDQFITLRRGDGEGV